MNTSLQQSFIKLGLTLGDNIFVHISMMPILYSLPENSRENACSIIYSALREVVGDSSIIAVLTATWETAKLKKDFILEETPTSKDLGIFSEYLRLHDLSTRTVHPLFSVCFNGPSFKRQRYCNAMHKYAFGISSPWNAMVEDNFKIVFIGLDTIKHLSLVHHVEQMIGVPYCYNKIFPKDVYRDGKKIEEDFFYSVPYRDMEIYYSDLFFLQEALIKLDILRETHWQRISIKTLNFKETFLYLQEQLFLNPYYLLLHKPQYKNDHPPCDTY